MRHTSTPPRRRIIRGNVDDICGWCREDLADHPFCDLCTSHICRRTECGCEGEGTVR